MSFQGPVWNRHHSLSHFICSPTRLCPPWVTLKQKPDCTSLRVKVSSPDPKRQENFSSNITAVSPSSPYATWHMVSIWKTYTEWMSEWMNEVLPALFPTASSHFTLQTLYFSQIGWLWVAADSIWLCFIEHLCAELRVWLTSCVIITTTQKGGRIPPILQMRKMRLTETNNFPTDVQSVRVSTWI